MRLIKRKKKFIIKERTEEYEGEEYAGKEIK